MPGSAAERELTEETREILMRKCQARVQVSSACCWRSASLQA